MTEEDIADQNTRRGFLVFVVLFVGLAILLNSTTCDTKSTCTLGDTDIHVERKELQQKLTECEAKLSSQMKVLNEKDIIISLLNTNYQGLRQTLEPLFKRSDDCGEVKMQLGKLQGIVEEQNRTAVASIIKYDEADKRKEKKIDGLVGNVSSLLVQLAECKKDGKILYEKNAGCDIDLQECKADLKKCWI